MPRVDAAQLGALAARAQLGDRAALEELLGRLQRPLYDHIRVIVGADDAAADVLQETLWLMCRRLGTLRDTAWVRAWAYRIAGREAFRSLHSERRRGFSGIEELGDLAIAVEPGPDMLDPATSQRLHAALDLLPPAAALVLRMRYLEELSQAEIAEALEIPIGTVKSRIAYGLAALRKQHWD